MKLLIVPIAFGATVILAGCKTPVYDADVQFAERLVIEGILAPGKQVTGIYIGKTLPVKTIFDPKNAEVHDAVATVVVDGIGYPLLHVGGGLYENANLVATAGKTYSITVEWNGLKAVGHTLVPFVPDTSSVMLTLPAGPYNSNSYVFTVDAAITPHPGETYGATWAHFVNYSYFVSDSLNGGEYVENASSKILRRDIDTQPDGKIHIELAGYLTESFPSRPFDTLLVAFSVFDEQFYDYFNSNGNSTSFENLVLGISPGAIKWNVSGDGIGMFIGRASISELTIFRWPGRGASMNHYFARAPK
jgi:hypothetical protein